MQFFTNLVHSSHLGSCSAAMLGWNHSLPVGLEVIVGPVVGKGNDQPQLLLCSLGYHYVHAAKGLLIVDARRCLQVEALLHGEAKHAHYCEIVPGCTTDMKGSVSLGTVPLISVNSSVITVPFKLQ